MRRCDQKKRRPTGKQIKLRETTWLAQIWRDVVGRRWALMPAAVRDTWRINERNQLVRNDDYEYQREVNKLTNWQRHQWAKAGRPGAEKKEAERVKHFAAALTMR